MISYSGEINGSAMFTGSNRQQWWHLAINHITISAPITRKTSVDHGLFRPWSLMSFPRNSLYEKVNKTFIHSTNQSRPEVIHPPWKFSVVPDIFYSPLIKFSVFLYSPRRYSVVPYTLRPAKIWSIMVNISNRKKLVLLSVLSGIILKHMNIKKLWLHIKKSKNCAHMWWC